MPKETTHHEGKRDDETKGEYAQVFLYRVPKANRDAFAATEGRLADIFRKCGILRSELYVLGDARVFRGFQDLRSVLGATGDEEVWVEIDTYRDAADSVQVIAKIGQDAEAGPLFGTVIQLASPGVLCSQGNAERVHP